MRLGRSGALDRLSTWLGTVAWWLWLAMLVAIPVTSFPLVREYVGDSSVYPLSALILFFLIWLWLIPYVLKNGRFPAPVRPLLLFAALALVSAAFGLSLTILPYKGQNPLSREIRALITLGIGLCFYLCSSTLPHSERRLRWSLRALYAGGFLMLIWSTIQATYVTDNIANIPQTLNEIQRLFSVRDLLRNRVSGLTFEPSWLGDQLVVLYLPLWIGSVLTRQSVFSARRSWVSIELVLSVWGTAILVMTRSRVSVVSLLAVAGVVYFLLVRAVITSWARRLMPDKEAEQKRLRRVLLLAALTLGLVFEIGVVYGLIRVGANYDWRLRRVLQVPRELTAIREQYPYAVIYELANRVAFAERLVYWRAAFSAYEAHPVLGVGPGNAGFYFVAGQPAYGYTLTEIRAIAKPGNRNFPNPKNLWIRLLAENGLVGLAAYLVWLSVLLGCAWSLYSRGSGVARTMGLVGLLALAAQLIEGFSLDSYALPQVWVINGLITVAYARLRPSPSGAAAASTMPASMLESGPADDQPHRPEGSP